MQLRHALIKQVAAELFEEHRTVFKETPYGQNEMQDVSRSKMENMVAGYLSRLRKR